MLGLLDNFWTPIKYQGHGSKVKVIWVFCVLIVCMKLLEPVALDSRIVIIRRHHFSTARRSNCRYPRALIEHGLTILLLLKYSQ